MDRVDDPRLEVEQERPRDVVLVVGLVEEDILAIARLVVRGVLLEDAVLADPVLRAELLPKLRADLVAALPHLERDDLARHGAR